MVVEAIAMVAFAFFAFSMVSGRLEGTVITAPMVFVAFGFGLTFVGLELPQLESGRTALHLVAEFTLILILFGDAARIDLKIVRQDHNLPARMLALGLPLTILVGTLIAQALFPYFSIWEAALLAALLAPTDAALGQSVVTAKAVPIRIRQAINIESGLNDGIALPAVLMFAALASAMHSAEEGSWVNFALLQITLGPLVGAMIGYLGGRITDSAAEHGWATNAFQGIAVLSLAVMAYLLAEIVGGNGFIAAFAGGMVFGNTIRHPCEFLFEFMETEGQLLMLVTFLTFGAVLLPEGLSDFQWSYGLYALLSLTIIRMIPIGVSLLGSKVRLPTYLFLGWFGPRGLASILFVLLILDEAEIANQSVLLTVTVITVVLSVLLHGLSAAPFANLYGRLAQTMGECEESKPVDAMPLRSGNIISNNPKETP